MFNIGNKVRRGNIKVKTIGKRHKLLRQFLYQQKQSRSLHKDFASALKNSSVDFCEWTRKEISNSAKNPVFYIGALLHKHATIQKKFSDNMKQYQASLGLILNGQMLVDKQFEKNQNAVRKIEIIKDKIQKIGDDETQQPTARDLLSQLTVAIEEEKQAENDLKAKRAEHDVFRTLQLKKSLLEYAAAQKELAGKSFAIFHGIKTLAGIIPEGEKLYLPMQNEDGVSRIFDETKELTERPDMIDLLHIPSGSQARLREAVTQLRGLKVTEDIPPPYYEFQPPSNPYL